MTFRPTRALAFVALALACSPVAFAGSPPATVRWVGSWAASQQLPEPQNALAGDDLHDATLRQIIHLSAGGTMLRVHLSNAFGTTALHLTDVHIAAAASASSSAIASASDRTLTFHGATSVTIPPGAEYLSDTVQFTAASLSNLAVSLHFDTLPERQTGHPGSRATSYLVHGNFASSADLPSARKIEHWYILSAVDVAGRAGTFAVVTLGDSITDGHGAGTDKNERWSDTLAQRLQGSPSARATGVLNQGIGGNHMLTDGLGPNVLARFDRDVLAQTNVRIVILLEGVNDIGALSIDGSTDPSVHQALVQRILSSYEQVVARAHDHGIKIIGATITPFTGSDYYHPGPLTEADRQQLNAWIRTPGNFDAVIDFDKVVADPKQPSCLLPEYDCGDHLHPSPAGYKAMGAAIPLQLLTPLD